MGRRTLQKFNLTESEVVTRRFTATGMLKNKHDQQTPSQ